MLKLITCGLLLGVRALDLESLLTEIVVNATTDTNTTTACLRAEFTADIMIDGKLYTVSALHNENAQKGSDCGLLTLNGGDIVNKNENITEKLGTLAMNFKEFQIDEKPSWQLTEISLVRNEQTYLNKTIPFVSAPLVGTYGQSFLCTAGFDVILPHVNGTEKDVILSLGRLQLQPFKVPEDTFANPVICSQDISVVVPAIVGSILGLLVIIVLITYVIGRRRTRIAYQEI